MSRLLSEMTREQIRRVAPDALAVFPVASIEQHGPHLPVYTDLLLCETVARAAVDSLSEEDSVVLTPALCFGNSHHHNPFPGVLSLTSSTFMSAITDVLESLILSGFRKIMLFNGHGGNTSSIEVVALDLVNRLGHPVSVATVSYWDIARPTLTGKGLIADPLLPGHAGLFETSMVMAIRPDLIDHEALKQLAGSFKSGGRIFEPLSGATALTHGVWGAGPGASDNPAEASEELGQTCLQIMVQETADLMATYSRRA